MSLAQYASPYNNESEVDNNTNQKNQGGKKISAATASSLSSSSLRKTIKRPLQQQQQQSQPSQPHSRVSDFMNKLNSQSVTTTTYIGDDDNGGGGDGTYGESDDLADYNPTTTADQQQKSPPGNDDGVVTKENFMDLPSSYAKQYYQQYIPHYNKSASPETTAMDAPKDELLEKMNHIIQMLEDQQDEKTGNVTEELILYCFLGVFVIFVVDSFARAGKYVR
jgi:hypothetical protein